MSDFTAVDEGTILHDWCGYCTSKQLFTEKGAVRTCHGCNQTFTVSRPTETDQLFEAARKLNPKPYRSSGKPADAIRTGRGIKCATIDCHLVAVDASIFCVACDNERLHAIGTSHPVSTTRIASGSVTEDIARRRKAIQDHKRGITKAVL